MKRWRPSRCFSDWSKVFSSRHFAESSFSSAGKLTFWSTFSSLVLSAFAISLQTTYVFSGFVWDEPQGPRYHPDSQGHHLGHSLGCDSGVISDSAPGRPALSFAGLSVDRGRRAYPSPSTPQVIDFRSFSRCCAAPRSPGGSPESAPAVTGPTPRLAGSSGGSAAGPGP